MSARTLTVSANGNSDYIIVPLDSNSSREWSLSIVSSTWSTMVITLQISHDATNWATATDSAGDVTFSKNEIKMIAPNLYYRISVANYAGSPITLSIRPT